MFSFNDGIDGTSAKWTSFEWHNLRFPVRVKMSLKENKVLSVLVHNSLLDNHDHDNNTYIDSYNKPNPEHVYSSNFIRKCLHNSMR